MHADAAPSGAVIAVRDLSVERSGRRVLAAVGFALAPDERLLIDGASGAGKSTLLHALLGFVPRSAGRIELLGRACASEADFAALRGPIGLLLQDPDDQLLGPSVVEDVEFGPLNLGLPPPAARRRAHEQLRRLGIEALAERPVHELSGGEKRLAALAGVLAMTPRALLLDEPTAGLDADSAQALLAALLATGVPMVVASHDPLCRERLATRALALRDGRLGAAG
jgi:cobalt/nickel transport system ATP-binding protein